MTTTIEERIEKGAEYVDELSKFGINASVYVKPPAGKDIFMIGKGNGIPGNIMLWPGSETVNVEIIGDESHKQAVLNVKEEKRTITQNVKMDVYNRSEADVSAAPERMINDLRSRFNIAVPASTRMVVDKIEYEPRLVHERDQKSWKNVTQWTVYARVRAYVPKTEFNFLIGKDETSLFIAGLPQPVKSVEAAHKLLRPEGIPADAPRQGEFFFIPATEEEFKACTNENPQVLRSYRGRSFKVMYSLETGSSHQASEVRANTGSSNYGQAKMVLVKGIISDSRKGHHKDLDLGDTWHKVVRNTEIAPNTNNKRSIPVTNSFSNMRPQRFNSTRWD